MRHHYVLTVQNGMSIYTWMGDYTPDPGETRSEAFLAIYGQKLSEARLGKAFVLCWVFEPDVLA